MNQFFRVTTNIGDKAILGLGLGIPLFFNCYDPAIFGKQRLSRLMVALLAWATIILVSRHVAEPSLTGQHISRHFISQYNANSFPNIFQVIALGANHYDGYAAHAITLYGVLIFRQVASCIPLLIMPSYRLPIQSSTCLHLNHSSASGSSWAGTGWSRSRTTSCGWRTTTRGRDRRTATTQLLCTGCPSLT